MRIRSKESSSTISKLYNNRRFIVDSTIMPTVSIPPIKQSQPATTYKTVSETLVRTDNIDGIITKTYRTETAVTHTYNNKGVVSTTHHNNTFTYVV
jgi:hypothetical protein